MIGFRALTIVTLLLLTGCSVIQSKSYTNEISLPDGYGRLAVSISNEGDDYVPGSEYRYTLHFVEGKQNSEFVLPEIINGGPLGNVYWYSAKPKIGPAIRIRYFTGEVLVDLKRRVIRRLVQEGNKIFCGDIKDGSNSSYSFWKPDESASLKVMIDGNEADDITSIYPGNGEYLGRIGESTFVPASKSAETYVKTQIEKR